MCRFSLYTSYSCVNIFFPRQFLVLKSFQFICACSDRPLSGPQSLSLYTTPSGQLDKNLYEIMENIIDNWAAFVRIDRPLLTNTRQTPNIYRDHYRLINPQCPPKCTFNARNVSPYRYVLNEFAILKRPIEAAYLWYRLCVFYELSHAAITRRNKSRLRGKVILH